MDFFLKSLGVAFLGYLIGNLINYFADVLPLTRRLSPVVCRHCGHAFSLVNYVLFRPCPSCKTPRPPRAYWVQASCMLLTLALWFFPPPRHLPLEAAWVLLLLFGVILVIDLEHRVILYQVSAVAAFCGIVLGSWLNGFFPSLLGGALGFGIMLVLYYLGEGFRRWVSRRRDEPIDEVALGFGDVTLGGILGLMLGWPRIGISLLFAILLGGLIGGLMLLVMVIFRRYRPFTALPYAPFMLVAAAILLYRL